MELQDVVNMVQVIDIASSRGAFQGKELSSVGALRDKLAAMIEQSQKPQETETETAEVETEAEG